MTQHNERVFADRESPGCVYMPYVWITCQHVFPVVLINSPNFNDESDQFNP